jgi:hypothetical protein
MTILSTDIKLRESERMTDTSDGGGRRTNRPVLDGVAGNVFPKVSRVDSVYGRVNFRKLYGHVDTANLDMYAGAHAIITDAPDNPRIHVCAFATGSDFDTRTAARDRVESYVITGPESRMTLYGRQLTGSQAILAYQAPSEALPEIGEVYALTVEVAGVTLQQQFVRLQDIAHEVRVFTDDKGTFSVRVLTLGVGSPLLYEFPGIDSPSRLSSEKGTGRMRTTRVADAARYFGIQPLLTAANLGDLTMLLPSIYTPIVPTTLRETGISLASPNGASMVLKAGTATLQAVVSPAQQTTQTVIKLPRAVSPGSLSLWFTAVGYNQTVTDDGAGNLPVGPIFSPAMRTSTVDYANGVITLNHQYAFESAQITVTYLPGAAVEQTAHTTALPITIGTRGSVYTPALLPIPAPGTLFVDFRALGKWYRLRDNGAGVLVGADPAYGTGTINFVTGGTIITLGALPDVGSSILLGWGSPVHYEILSALPAAAFQMTLTGPVRPTSVVLTWLLNAVEKTAVDDGAGLITGDATGTINYQTGEVGLTLVAPITGVVHAAFDKASPLVTSGNKDFGAAILPRTVHVEGVRLTFPNGAVSTYAYNLEDDGNGALFLPAGWGRYLPTNGGNQRYYLQASSYIFGTVNYATGVVTINPSLPVVHAYWFGNEWLTSPPENATTQTAGVTYSATLSAAPPAIEAKTQDIQVGTTGIGLGLKLSPQKPLQIVQNSLVFTAFGKTYIDRNGTIYADVSAATGSGTEAGTINYATGVISLSDYPTGVAANFVVRACLGKKGDYTSDRSFFRTAGSPLRPASTYIQATAADGELLSAASDQNGNIAGTLVSGTVDQTMGVISLQFSKQVMPDSVRYSTVVLSNLPLNSSILGLDPVRLPSDGRVPIYRSADVAVVHHTGTLDVGTPAAASVHSMGRTGLSMLWLQDAMGAKLPLTLYTSNLDAGTLTIAADAVFTGFTMPLSAKHRIEEMTLLTDVQINGQISIAAPLLRNYPVSSFVSSALLFGDLFARVTGVFDQETWTGLWSDTLIGNNATPQFNDVDYPIEVLNDAATTGRWRLNFTSPTTYQVIGEQLGVIATGTTLVDMQPVNLLTGKAYFTIRANAFGLGWAVGNQLRFNTVGATPPFWLARTVLPGASLAGDSFDAQLRGDVD